MCLIAHREVKGGRGSNIPNSVIEYNRTKNPDGFGIAWRNNGKIQYQKFAPSDVGAFEKLLKSIDRQTHIEYVAHWRLATTGKPCENLSHPFPYEDAKDGEVLVFHNGVIDIDVADKERESDTLAFVRDVLARLEPRWWNKSHLRFLVEGSTGWSRLLLMTKKRTIRLNTDGWNLDNGIWYSQRQWSNVPVKQPNVPMAVVPATTSDIISYVGGRKSWEDSTDDSDAYLEWQEKRYGAKRLADSIDENEDESNVAWSGWSDGGHWVYPVTGLDQEGLGGEPFGTVICGECNTEGDYYVEDGKCYADIVHGNPIRERVRVN